MECVIEFTNPLARFEFSYREDKQPILIDILLKFGQLDLANLAALLEIPTDTLDNAYRNNQFLKDQSAINLSKIFLIFISS